MSAFYLLTLSVTSFLLDIDNGEETVTITLMNLLPLLYADNLHAESAQDPCYQEEENILLEKISLFLSSENHGLSYKRILRGYQGDNKLGLLRSDGAVDVLMFQKIKNSNEVLVRFLFFSDNTSMMCDSRTKEDAIFEEGLGKLLVKLDQCELSQVVDVYADQNQCNEKATEQIEKFLVNVTPQMRNHVGTVMIKQDQDRHGSTIPELGVISVTPNKDCEWTMYHEVAHNLTGYYLKTNSIFISNWNRINENLPVNFDPDLAEKSSYWPNHGYVTKSAAKDFNEDISEVTRMAYTEIDVLKDAIRMNPEILRKVGLLYQFGYIHEEQYLFLQNKISQKPKMSSFAICV